MKTKKLLSAVLILSLSLITVACSGNKNENSSTTIANPLVPVASVSEFESKLGIAFDENYIPEDANLTIIAGNLAEIKYFEDNVNDEEVEVTLRASKNTSEDISGVYDENMTSSELSLYNVDFTERISESTGYEIYDFEKDGVKYCFMVHGEVSQMMMGELLDRTMLICKLPIE